MDNRKYADIIRKIAYLIAAALVFVLLVLFTFPDRQQSLVRTEYPVVILGDSLLGQCRDETGVAELLGGMLGEPVFNGAFGGTCLALQEQDIISNYSMELLNMVSLSKALAADDYGVQQTIRTRREITGYFADTIDELECVDFHRVETLILAFGLNDYHAGIPMDNPANPLDETTYAGALRSVLSALQEAYPRMRIVLATPTYAWYRANGLTCEEFDTGSAFLEGYVETTLDIAEEFRVECVDLYHNVYVHDTWEDWEVYTEDGLHPNEEGRRLIAGILAGKLRQEPDVKTGCAIGDGSRHTAAGDGQQASAGTERDR